MNTSTTKTTKFGDIPEHQQAEVLAHQAYDLYNRQRRIQEFEAWQTTYPNGFFDTEENRADMKLKEDKLQGDILLYNMMLLDVFEGSDAYDLWVSKYETTLQNTATIEGEAA